MVLSTSFEVRQAWVQITLWALGNCTHGFVRSFISLQLKKGGGIKKVQSRLNILLST